jgi:hypothetical protein
LSEPKEEKEEVATEPQAEHEVEPEPEKEKEEVATGSQTEHEALSEPKEEKEEVATEHQAEQEVEPGPEKEKEEVASESHTQQEVVQEPGPTPVSEVLEQPQQEIPGVAFTERLIELLDYELNERFLGWRPNDLLVGRLTDNVREFQLGALEAIRSTAIKLKESLTRLGDADAYDPHLVEAVNLLMHRADQYWFPSTESQYELAVEKLRVFLTDLKQGKSRFDSRTDNLLALLASYEDLLGNCYENLVKHTEPDGSRVSHFQADNYFYYCQGVAHVMYEMLKTVRLEFEEQLKTINAVAHMDKIIADLGHASEISPWLITNGDADDILANHRYNLAAAISPALHNLSTMLGHAAT